MALESGMVTKIAAAVGLAGISSAGVYYGQDYFSPKSPLSKYDRALIAFLNKDGQDIVFDVKKVNNGTASDNFAVSDLTLSNGTSAVQAEVKLTVANGQATSTNLKVGGQNANNEQLKALKEVGKNKSWTWSCVLEFKKKSGATKTALKEADRILKSGDTGLLGILKKELHNYTDPTSSEDTKWKKADLKKAKEDFITQCAKERKDRKSAIDAEENDVSTELKVTKTFELVDETSGSESDRKLVASNDSDFNIWFKEQFKNKTFTTSTSG